MKLHSKQREGKKVRCVYDPAKTPLQRLLLSGILPAQKQQELTEVAHTLDPIRLFRCAVSCSPFISPIPSANIRVFSVDDCMVGKLPEKRSVPDPTAGLQTLYPASRSGENASWGGGAPTKTPLKESGNRSPTG
jgi:hypothetical protein